MRSPLTRGSVVFCGILPSCPSVSRDPLSPPFRFLALAVDAESLPWSHPTPASPLLQGGRIWFLSAVGRSSFPGIGGPSDPLCASLGACWQPVPTCSASSQRGPTWLLPSPAHPQPLRGRWGGHPCTVSSLLLMWLSRNDHARGWGLFPHPTKLSFPVCERAAGKGDFSPSVVRSSSLRKFP